MRNNKKQLYAALLIVLCLFVFSFMFLIIINKSNSSNSKVNNDILKVNYVTNKKVVLNNTLPVSDQLGKNFNGDGVDEGIQEYSEFKITNTMDEEVNYEIYLVKNKSEDEEISGKYIKLYLTDENDVAFDDFSNNQLPTFFKLPVLNDVPGGSLLFKGKLGSKEEKSFKLRTWLSDTYAISKSHESFSFTIKVRAV